MLMTEEERLAQKIYFLNNCVPIQQSVFFSPKTEVHIPSYY
jgi:hypothetical protein